MWQLQGQNNNFRIVSAALARVRYVIYYEKTLQIKKNSTLVSLIIVQDGINVQDGKIPKVNKRAGWNKAVQDGLFHFSLV